MTPRPGSKAGPAILSDLKGLGPKSQAMLAQVGITTIEQLRQKGSVAAYCLAKRANAKVSLNLLWGLESALTAEPWQEIARVHRTSLLLAVEAHEKND
jgi:DNA transformation protein